MDILKFEQLYRRCFDENDNLTFCGRQACKDLLTFLNDDKYGNKATGMLNVDEIVKLHNSVVR